MKMRLGVHASIANQIADAVVMVRIPFGAVIGTRIEPAAARAVIQNEARPPQVRRFVYR